MILPFLDPEDDIYINLSIILKTLGKTSRGTLKVNNSKLHIFLYLIKNPMTLNKILGVLGKGTALLRQSDTYSITSISPNLDPLFDREALKALLSILVAKSLVTVVYKKDNGFFYTLSESGAITASEFHDEYLFEVSLLCNKLKRILSLSESRLNQTLNQIIRKESI